MRIPPCRVPRPNGIRREFRSRWLAGAVAALLTACASPTVERSDDDPRTYVLPGRGDYEWTADRGWVKPESGDWGSVDDIRRSANAAFAANEFADALHGFSVLKERVPTDEHTELHFQIAECYYHLGLYDAAVEYYRRVYREGKPEESVADQVRQRIYEIALDFLHGRAACTAIGIPYECPRHGVDLLVGEDGLITEYPYLSFADDALMEIAGHYFEERQYPEAVPFYERVVRDYATGEWAGTAQFQLALAWFRQIRGTDYDEKIIQQADSELRDYLRLDPRGPHAKEAREKLLEISEMLAAKYLKVAKFYLRESEPRSALIYLSLVLDRYTNSRAAREAREIQKELDRLEVGG